MKTTCCPLLILILAAPFFVGCDGVKQAPAPMEETAIISCEAACVTIETSSSGRKEGEFNEIVSPTNK